MDVGAGRPPGRSHPRDRLPALDMLAQRHLGGGQMAVARGDAVAVIDLDEPAIAAALADEADASRRGGEDRLAVATAKIEPGMEGRAPAERVAAHAEAAGAARLARRTARGHRGGAI